MKRLFRKDFNLVIIGQIISLFGNNILRFALPLYVLRQTSSAALFGLVSAGAFIPMVIMSPIGGIIADRVNKQRIMVVLDAFTTVIIAAFMLLMSVSSMIPLVVVMLMLLYGIQGTYSPAVQASIPLLAESDLLTPANAVVNLVQSLARLLGPVIGGILFGGFGLRPILAVSCACFTFSAFIELFIKIPFQKQPPKKSVWALVKGDIKESVCFIIKSYPVMSKVIAIVFCMNLFMTTMLLVGLPVIITEYLDISSELYGISQGAMAAGGLLGGVLAGVFSHKIRLEKAYLQLMFCAAAIIPICLVLLIGITPFICYLVLTVMSALLIAGATLFDIQMLSFAQAATPGNLVGKVIALVMTLAMCAQPIGQSLYGLLFEYFADSPWVVVAGSAIVSLAVAGYSCAVFRRLPQIVELRNYDRRLQP